MKYYVFGNDGKFIYCVATKKEAHKLVKKLCGSYYRGNKKNWNNGRWITTAAHKKQKEMIIMYTRCFERDNEVVNISEYGFEWYVDDKVVRSGCVENIDEDIASLIEEGFTEVVWKPFYLYPFKLKRGVTNKRWESYTPF